VTKYNCRSLDRCRGLGGAWGATLGRCCGAGGVAFRSGSMSFTALLFGVGELLETGGVLGVDA
jgi:hypothetical protein